jgi:hypothetical protein
LSGQDDFVDALRAIMAAKREELGEPPAPDELLAWRDGRLDPAARERLEARIAVYPEAARALADLAAFPAIEPAPGVQDVSAEEVGARWQTFRQKLADLPPSQSPAVPPAPVLRHEPRASRAPQASHGYGYPARGLAAAASVALAVGLGGGYLAGRASLDPAPDSSINVTIADLLPVEDGGDRAARPSANVELAEDSEELMLILNADDPGEFSGYSAEILDAQGARVWSREGLQPTKVGTFQISFRRNVLLPGTYRIDLFGTNGEERRLLARYEVRIVETL